MKNKMILTDCLKTIASRLSDLGNAAESAKVDQIRRMVGEGDLTDPLICGAIHDKNEELKPGGKAFTEQLEKLRQAGRT